MLLHKCTVVEEGLPVLLGGFNKKEKMLIWKWRSFYVHKKEKNSPFGNGGLNSYYNITKTTLPKVCSEINTVAPK